MRRTEYKALIQEPAVFDDLGNIERSLAGPLVVQKCSYLIWLLGLMLSVSLFLNLLHYIPTSFQADKLQCNQTYTGRLKDIPTKLVPDNRTVDDAIWTSDRFELGYGMVALDEEFIREHGLPPADKYPWDHSKSVYLLQGYHVMHCVLVFRDLIMNVRDGQPSRWPHEHMVHCLNVLREEIECHADDFPLNIRIPSLEKEDETTPGKDQIRMCRGWDGLQDFAIKNTACWSKREYHKGDPIIDMYKRCPDGSKPWQDLDVK